MTDQYEHWARALREGKPIETGSRDDGTYVRSGFYKANTKQGLEAVAFWRDEAAALQCRRTIFGDGSKLSQDEMEELFSQVCRYPIEHEVWQSVRAGNPFPPGYETRLSLQEIKDGVAWTAELRLAKLGVQEPERNAAENPRAVIGDNQPTEPTPAEALALRVEAVSTDVVKWLGEIGGAPRDKAEADRIADYATKFGELKGIAETEHKVEKEPHLKAGREVDTKWFGIRDKAAALRKRCLDIADKWMKAEAARRAEEARKATEEARRRAEEAARETGATAEPVAEVKAEPVKIGNTRTVSQRARAVYRVTDLQAAAAYIAAMESPPPDFVDVVEKIGRRMLDAGVRLTWIEKDSDRSAA